MPTWSAFILCSYVLHRPWRSGPLDPLNFGSCSAGGHHHPIHLQPWLCAGGELSSDLLQPWNRHSHLDVSPAPLRLWVLFVSLREAQVSSYPRWRAGLLAGAIPPFGRILCYCYHTIASTDRRHEYCNIDRKRIRLCAKSFAKCPSLLPGVAVWVWHVVSIFRSGY